jgi:MFS family permease
MTSNYRWVIVAAGAFIGCIAIGSIFALPVFLQPMAQETGWSRTEISAAMTVSFVAMGIASFLWGMAVDRFGPRIVLLSGSTLLGLGLALASRAPTPFAFQLIFGLLVGAAGGAIFPPLMATVTGWFETRRSLAVSLVSAGMGMAPMTVAPIAAQLVIFTDWRTAMLMIGIGVWVLLIPTAFLIRRAPALKTAARAPGAAPPMSARQALRSPQFIVLALTYFCCCAAHSGPIFHTVSYAMTCGLPVATAVTIYSVEGLAGLAGRVIFGLSGDRFGAKPVLVTGLLIQALAAGAYSLAGQLDQFYAVAIVFGMAYAGVMPLYAVIARETFPLQIMGTVIGAASLFSSLGMSLGPLAGGLIFDATASYRWLYLGSLAIGLGAMAIMLTFRPPGTPRALTVPS